MKKSYLIKGLAVGIICLLMLVSIPTVVGDDEIEFPKEDGPYTIFVSGWHLGSFLIPIMAGKGLLIIGPMVYMKYPNRLAINMHYSGTTWEHIIMFVDGQEQAHLIESYNRIEIFGFKGYFPGVFLQMFKDFPLQGYGRNRAFGICEEINFISPILP